MTKLLITRPAPFAAETAARLSALGYDCAIAPALAARHVAPFPVALNGNPVVLVTSPQAALALAAWRDLHHLQVLAVGAQTAALLRASGFTHVTSADSDAAGLLDLIKDSYITPQDFILAVAPSTGQLLQDALQRAGHRTLRLDVYEMMPVASLPASDLPDGALTGVTHVLLQSARSAAAFLAQVEGANLIGNLPQITALCLSEAVADAAKMAEWRAVQVAGAPTTDALHKLLPAIE